MHDTLVEVALNHFAGRGVDHASLAEIAADARRDLAVLRAEFESADDLFDACVATATGGLSADLLEIVDDDVPPADRLLRMTRRLATPTTTEALALFSIARELVNGQTRAIRAFRESLGDSFEALSRIIGEAQFRGQLVPLPPRFVATVLLSGVVVPQLVGWGGAEGRLGGIHAREEPGEPRSALLAASIEALFCGLLCEPIDLDPRGAVH